MTFYNAINHNLRFVACFSPKCGCTTLRKWFLHAAPDADETSKIDHYMVPAGKIAGHSEYTKVLFIRDPFRRLVSFYCHFVVRDTRRWCYADQAKQRPLQGKSFSEFLHILDDLATQGLEFQHHLVPQLHKLGAIRFDTVIAVERLDELLPELNAALGIEYEVPKLNTSPYAGSVQHPVCDTPPETLKAEGFPTAEYFYNPALVVLVEKLYAVDLRCYRAYHDDSILFPAVWPFYARWRARFGLARTWRRGQTAPS